MQPNQRLSPLIGKIMITLEGVFSQEQPDWVLVHGDTATAIAASLVAFYQQVKIGHVEAGLRTGNKAQPFPEEVNRHIIDVLATLCFAPTRQGQENLKKEGVLESSIIMTGNTGIDALRMVLPLAKKAPLETLVGDLAGKRLILVAVHRRENFGQPLERICQALRQVAYQHPDNVHIVFVEHLNPNIFEPARKRLRGVPNISCIEPVDYVTMVALMSRAYLILTDSGGVQEEAPSMGKPVLVFGEVTERQEVVEAGLAKLIGTVTQTVVEEIERLLQDSLAYQKMVASVKVSPYGDGFASQRIVRAILKRL
jgi:UDP-N-acetylglucosamine 2-epimerase (non-hydrolysing)